MRVSTNIKETETKITNNFIKYIITLGQARFVWPLFWIIRWVRNRTDNEISEDKKTQMQHNIQGF